MPKKEIKKVYSFADADLKEKADALYRALKRDLIALAARNITKQTLSEFRMLIRVFNCASTEEELLDTCKMAITEKDESVKRLRRMLLSIRNIAELTFEGRGHFHTFGFEGIMEMNDNDLSLLAKRVLRVSVRLLAEMASKGLSSEQLAALENLRLDLVNKIDLCHATDENRDIETQERIKKGNELYTELMRLASVGTSLFKDKDKARYNDYAIIGGKGSADKLQVKASKKVVMALATTAG